MGSKVEPNIEKLERRGNVKGLIKALRHERERIQRKAAEALGRIGDPRAIGPLISILRDSYLRDLQKTAGKALGEIGDARAIKPLFDMIRGNNSGLRDLAEDALVQISIKCDFALDELLPAVRDRNVYVRAAVAEALGQLRDPRVLEPLLSLLKDEDGYVRSRSAYALIDMGWKPKKDAFGAQYFIVKGKWDECVQIGEPAVEPLIQALKYKGDLGYTTRTTAVIESLEKIGDQRAVEPIIAVLNDDNGDLRLCAAKVLVKLYLSGKLEDHQKQKILALRNTIEGTGKPHIDARLEPTDCDLRMGNHEDISADIVEFPL